KQTICMSTLLQNTNRRCNAVQSVLGVFMHACNTPDKVIETFAHSGLSISSTAINQSIKSLVTAAADNVRKLGQTGVASYGYDNFDIDLKTGLPTVEKDSTTLKHLTSGTLLPLEHGVVTEDLKWPSGNPPAANFTLTVS
ncbi:hypothetical protein FA95DRAFT_1495650, partial [Auriscalpium vulgare]